MQMAMPFSMEMLICSVKSRSCVCRRYRLEWVPISHLEQLEYTVMAQHGTVKSSPWPNNADGHAFQYGNAHLMCQAWKLGLQELPFQEKAIFPLEAT